MSRLLVTLCTYNERDNLAPLITEIHASLPQADIVVVDDNSPDGTWQLAQELGQNDPRVKLLFRPKKEGLGEATKAALLYGIEHGYEFLINMDADFSHPPRFLPALMQAIPEQDVVIASRYVAGGGVAGWTLSRKLMSRLINTYARWSLGLRTKDNSGSFRCFRVSKLKEMDPAKLRARGYAIEEEILYRLKQVGSRFTEVPFTYEDRRAGETKINWQEAARAVWYLGTLRFR